MTRTCLLTRFVLAGEVVTVQEKLMGEWWRASNESGAIGAGAV